MNSIQGSYWQRLSSFAEIIYEPKQHLLFAALWFLSIQGLFVLHSPSPAWIWGLPTLISALTFFGVLFVLRAIDEVKDLAYDRQYNPDRPLVSGAVNMGDIRSYVIFGTVLVTAANLLVAWQLALFVVLNVGYGLLLMWFEKVIPLMDRSMFFNLLLTYPVSIALSVYTLLQIQFTQGVEYRPYLLLIICCYILAFLHFEIIRKSMWQNLSEPGEKLYSSELGTEAALTLGSLCGVLAICGMLLLNQPWQLSGLDAATGWLPLSGLILVTLSLKRFLSNRETRFNPRKFAVLFIVTFYLFNFLHAIINNPLQWSLGL